MLQNAVGRLTSRLAKVDLNSMLIARPFATANAKPEPNEEKRIPRSAGRKQQDNEVPSTNRPHTKKTKELRETLFGIHPVEICLDERKRTLYKIFCSKLDEGEVSNDNIRRVLEKASARQIPIKEIDPNQMNVLTKKAAHQGIALQVSPLEVKPWIEAMESFGETDDSGQLCVYIDRVQDPMNMGAIIRTAVFLGIDGIFVPTKHSCRLSPVVAKASAGALECAPLYSVDDSFKFFTFLQRLGWDIIGSDQDCAPYSDYKATERNRLVVLGNESQGVHEDLVSFFTSTVSIPSFSKRISSLNVSVTSGVLLSHFVTSKRP